MISGIGIDTISISRVARLLEKHGERFLGKIFTARERTEGAKRISSAPFYAARFAAREAFYKALGTGWGRGLPLKEVSVVTDDKGRPSLELGERVRRELEDMGIDGCHLSLTHDGDSAIAVVILEKR
jgi:holo-[acyl-carrier protein] synthase